VFYQLHYYFILHDSKVKVRLSLCLIKHLTVKEIRFNGDTAPHILTLLLDMDVISGGGQASHSQHMPVYQWQNVHVNHIT
jgi:hypothetical protein